MTLSDVTGGTMEEQFSARFVRHGDGVAVAVSRARRRLVTIEPGASIREAALLMGAEGISALVVGTPGHRISLVTERDVTRAVAAGQPPEAEVESISSPDPATIDVTDTVMTAALAMLQLEVRHLVVIEDRRAVGIVSMRDVLAELVSPTW